MRFPSILLLFTLGTTLAQDGGHSHSHLRAETEEREGRHLKGSDDHGGHCATKEPERSDHEARARAESFSKFKASRKGGSLLESSATRVIPVCFHNPQWWFSFRNKHNDRYISDERLQAQLDHLNEAFTTASCCDSDEPWCNGECSPVNIDVQFVMARVDGDGNIIGTTDSTSDSDACITRRQGHRWMRMSSGEEVRIKSALHVGDERTLNVYYIRVGSGGVLGFSSFPWHLASTPKLDGVVIEPTSVKGGVKRYFDEGDTLVHEVG
jgi:hypothetical protein